MLGKDPTVAVAAGTVTSLAPIMGEYAVILLGATAGALVALSSMELSGRKAISYLFRSIVSATMLSSFAAAWLSDKVGHPVQELLLPVAFTIALTADRLTDIKEWALGRLKDKP